MLSSFTCRPAELRARLRHPQLQNVSCRCSWNLVSSGLSFRSMTDWRPGRNSTRRRWGMRLGPISIRHIMILLDVQVHHRSESMTPMEGWNTRSIRTRKCMTEPSQRWSLNESGSGKSRQLWERTTIEVRDKIWWNRDCSVVERWCYCTGTHFISLMWMWMNLEFELNP